MGVSIEMCYLTSGKCSSGRISHRGDPKNCSVDLSASTLSSGIRMPEKLISSAIAIIIRDGNFTCPNGKSFLLPRFL